MKECFEYAGMPEELCDQYIEQGFIKLFQPTAQVVTKEWVIQQYREFIGEDKV